MSFKYLHGWQLNHFPGEPVLTLDIIDIIYVNNFFPYIQSKPPLEQPEDISAYSITCYLEKRLAPIRLQPTIRQL